MVEYCTDLANCRRQIFAEKFTEQKGPFARCPDKCDNCRSMHGNPRRNFMSKTQSDPAPSARQRSTNLAEKQSHSTGVSVGGKSTAFVKASSLRTTTTSSSTTTTTSLSGPFFAKASSLLRKNTPSTGTGSNAVISLVENDDCWLEPLPKRTRKQ
jgi:hypothetical protein